MAAPSAYTWPSELTPQALQSRSPLPLPCSVNPVIHTSASEEEDERNSSNTPLLGEVSRTYRPSSHSWSSTHVKS